LTAFVTDGNEIKHHSTTTTVSTNFVDPFVYCVCSHSKSFRPVFYPEINMWGESHREGDEAEARGPKRRNRGLGFLERTSEPLSPPAKGSGGALYKLSFNFGAT